MTIVPQTQRDGYLDSSDFIAVLHSLDAALAARVALARSVSPVFAQCEHDTFAQTDAQVNQQIETATIYLIAHEHVTDC